MCVCICFSIHVYLAQCQKKSTNGKTRFLPFVHSIEICSFCLRIWHTGICWHIFGTDWVSEIENAWWGVNIVNKWREKCAVLTWTVANTYNKCSMSHDSWICLLEFRQKCAGNSPNSTGSFQNYSATTCLRCLNVIVHLESENVFMFRCSTLTADFALINSASGCER
jgi:hypothetical protein